MSAYTTAIARPLWVVLAVVAYLATIVTNALANLLPLFGRVTGDISDSFPSLFTPAGYAFSVWGVIYLALAGFVIYQASARGRAEPRLVRLRPLFVLSCLFNVGWLVSWHALQIGLSQVLMLALLVTLIAMYRASGAWRRDETPAFRWTVHVPLSLYLGWISVATIANTAIFLLDLGFDGGSAAVLLTAVMIVAATVLGLLGAATRRDAVYALVIAWGLGGVAVARAGESAVLQVTALACVVVLVAAAAWAVMTGARERTVRSGTGV